MSVDKTIRDILDKEQPASSDASDRIIYLGEAHDAYPRLLVLDKDLSATEKILWMYLRLFVDLDQKSKPCPTYDDMMCDMNIGSRETISNALLVLRGTRWISIIGPRRDYKNRVTQNLYALHSEPLNPNDVIELDDNYLQVLDKMQHHRSSKIQNLGKRLDEGVQHYLIHQSAPYSSLEQLNTRMAAQEAVSESTPKSKGVFFNRHFNHEDPVQLAESLDQISAKSGPSTKIELGSEPLVRKSNLGVNLDKTFPIRPSKYENRTTISSSSGNYINTTTTENSKTLEIKLSQDHRSGDNTVISQDHRSGDMHFFDTDIHLTANEKTLLSKLLLQIETEDRQRMIDELAGQVIEKRGTPYQIRNTIAFAGTLIKLYLKGTPSWSSSCEVMAQKRQTDQSAMSDDQRKALEEKAELIKETQNEAHRKKLKQWEAELAAKKQQGDKSITINPAKSPLPDKGQS